MFLDTWGKTMRNLQYLHQKAVELMAPEFTMMSSRGMKMRQGRALLHDVRVTSESLSPPSVTFSSTATLWQSTRN